MKVKKGIIRFWEVPCNPITGFKTNRFEKFDIITRERRKKTYKEKKRREQEAKLKLKEELNA